MSDDRRPHKLKTEIVGRQYSKVSVDTYDFSKVPKESRRDEYMRLQKQADATYARDMDEVARSAVELASAVLAQVGLPTCRNVLFDPSEPNVWIDADLDEAKSANETGFFRGRQREELVNSKSEYYVFKRCSLNSIESHAAEVLHTAWRILAGDREPLRCFQLGTQATLLEVYVIENQRRAAIHRQDGRKEVWEQWRIWQKSLLAEMPSLNAPGKKSAQARILKARHKIDDDVATIRKRLEPLPRS